MRKGEASDKVSTSVAPTTTGVERVGWSAPSPHPPTPPDNMSACVLVLFTMSTPPSLTAGCVHFSSTHHDWSDGFRLVCKQLLGSSFLCCAPSRLLRPHPTLPPSPLEITILPPPSQ